MVELGFQPRHSEFKPGDVLPFSLAKQIILIFFNAYVAILIKNNTIQYKNTRQMQILFIVCLPTKKHNHSGNLFWNYFISDTHPG